MASTRVIRHMLESVPQRKSVQLLCPQFSLCCPLPVLRKKAEDWVPVKKVESFQQPQHHNITGSTMKLLASLRPRRHVTFVLAGNEPWRGTRAGGSSTCSCPQPIGPRPEPEGGLCKHPRWTDCPWGRRTSQVAGTCNSPSYVVTRPGCHR